MTSTHRPEGKAFITASALLALGTSIGVDAAHAADLIAQAQQAGTMPVAAVPANQHKVGVAPINPKVGPSTAPVAGAAPVSPAKVNANQLKVNASQHKVTAPTGAQ